MDAARRITDATDSGTVPFGRTITDASGRFSQAVTIPDLFDHASQEDAFHDAASHASWTTQPRQNAWPARPVRHRQTRGCDTPRPRSATTFVSLDAWPADART